MPPPKSLPPPEEALDLLDRAMDIAMMHALLTPAPSPEEAHLYRLLQLRLYQVHLAVRALCESLELRV